MEEGILMALVLGRVVHNWVVLQQELAQVVGRDCNWELVLVEMELAELGSCTLEALASLLPLVEKVPDNYMLGLGQLAVGSHKMVVACPPLLS